MLELGESCTEKCQAGTCLSLDGLRCEEPSGFLSPGKSVAVGGESYAYQAEWPVSYAPFVVLGASALVQCDL